jgi:hypothetical protein
MLMFSFGGGVRPGTAITVVIMLPLSGRPPAMIDA